MRVRCIAILGAMNERPAAPPWGLLIAQALKKSRMSAREAAKRAGMSDGRWRQIVSGYQTVSAGVYAPVRGPAETLARMAQVVGVTPEQLEQAGRSDAAAELRELPSLPEPEQELTARELTERLRELTAEFEAERERTRRESERMQREIDRMRRGNAG